MNIHGKHYRTIWVDPQRPEVVQVIDQRLLPFEFKILDLTTVDDVRLRHQRDGRARRGFNRRDGGLRDVLRRAQCAAPQP